MKPEKIVIMYGNGSSITVNSRAEAAKIVKHLLADYVYVEIENVSLKIQQADEESKTH